MQRRASRRALNGGDAPESPNRTLSLLEVPPTLKCRCASDQPHAGARALRRSLARGMGARRHGSARAGGRARARCGRHERTGATTPAEARMRYGEPHTRRAAKRRMPCSGAKPRASIGSARGSQHASEASLCCSGAPRAARQTVVPCPSPRTRRCPRWNCRRPTHAVAPATNPCWSARAQAKPGAWCGGMPPWERARAVAPAPSPCGSARAGGHARARCGRRTAWEHSRRAKPACASPSSPHGGTRAGRPRQRAMRQARKRGSTRAGRSPRAIRLAPRTAARDAGVCQRQTRPRSASSSGGTGRKPAGMREKLARPWDRDRRVDA